MIARGSAADEVHDFEMVSLAELDLGPAVTGHDVTVQLYGDAVGFHAEEIYERGERERRWAIE